MMYVATRNVQLVYRNARGKQHLGTVNVGELTPEGAVIEQADEWVARGWLRPVSAEEAARVRRAPKVDPLTAATFLSSSRAG